MEPLLTDLKGFDRLYGLEVLAVGEEEVSARVQVRDELLQPAGLVHGGVLASIAESITSMATWHALREEGMAAMGQSNHTSSCARSSPGRSTPWRGGATAAGRPGCGTSTSPTTTTGCAPSCG